MSKSILLIEDDSSVTDLLQCALTGQGFSLSVVARGDQGLAAASAGSFDLIILDINLPGMNGLEVLSRLRYEGSNIQVLLLTTRAAEVDLVKGLTLGADDYVVKPFSIHELMARVEARLRRINSDSHRTTSASDALHFESLCINPLSRKVLHRDEEIQVTAKEFDVLFFLASNPDTTFSREQLLQEIWGIQNIAYERNVITLVNRLRRKLEPHSRLDTHIENVRSIGYRFNPKPQTSFENGDPD